MDTLFLENFRCFAGKHAIPIAPLTVLVGENSSGKSSLLAAFRLAFDLLQSGAEEIAFNDDRFHLGAYDQIATTLPGRRGRSTAFSLGVETTLPIRFPTARVPSLNAPDDASRDPILVDAEFQEQRAQPNLSRFSVTVGSTSVHLESRGERPSATVHTATGDWTGNPFPEGIALRRAWFYWQPGSPLGMPGADNDLVRSVLGIMDRFGLGAALRQRPYAFAPVRSRPRRTYDPIGDAPNPEGEHIPMVLANLLERPPEGGLERGLHTALVDFGSASGLFDDVIVKRLDKESDPFQIMLKMLGATRNLIDVGYGVSQVLPLVIEILRSPPGRTFLIQQPEVHLHPRAQAALASLFGALVRRGRCRLLVETHSDYFIDRLRSDVRDGNGPDLDELCLLYFEAGKAGTKVHPITFDELGNLEGAPPSYRTFFMEEERHFLGLS